MRERDPEAEIVGDIASGLNTQRKRLKSLLGCVLRREKRTLVVTHTDRFARFGFERDE